ncbi:hypothetical protein MW887_005683 [Aspergillus wentii]|nr:hypothetical protein MW887_005683 [Aspergillus wentii]
MYSSLLAIVGGLSTLTAALPSSAPQEPCAQLSHTFKEWKSAYLKNPKSVDHYLPGDLVHECLQTIPFDSKRAIEFLAEARKYLQFQSTTEILKNPPSGYLMPAVDLFGGLDFIEQQAANNKYASQTDFDVAIHNLLSSAHDGHLSIQGMCSQLLFNYQITMPVVSVSSDGLQLPQIYAANDLPLLRNGSHQVSPVVKVDGEDAETFFKSQSMKAGNQDPDALYNSVFHTFARGGIGSSTAAGTWTVSTVWPGQSNYTFEFGNGTTRQAQTVAVPKSKSFDYGSGKEIFKDLCIPKKASSSSAIASSSATPASSSSALLSATPTPTPSSGVSGMPAPTTLPKAVVREPNNFVSGYFLNEKDTQDVAVLLIPTFAVKTPYLESFVNSTAKFLKEAAAAGKKKLVIDVTGNGGGLVELGQILFKFLFPNAPIQNAGRFRFHEAINLMGKTYGYLDYNDGPEDLMEIRILNGFARTAAVTPDQKRGFKTVSDLYGPHEIMGQNVSSLFSNNLTLTSETPGLAQDYDITAPLFKPENILLVTDGYCASTCTIFSENLKDQGVKSLVFGGRPQDGPMQAIGGVKGSQAAEQQTFDLFVSEAQGLQAASVENGEPLLTPEEMKRFNETVPGLKDLALPGKFNVNLKNQYASEDSIVPLQFVYEAADCRLFYTAENILRPGTSWAKAARTFWGNGKCVAGSSDKATPSGKPSSSATASATPSSTA